MKLALRFRLLLTITSLIGVFSSVTQPVHASVEKTEVVPQDIRRVLLNLFSNADLERATGGNP